MATETKPMPSVADMVNQLLTVGKLSVFRTPTDQVWASVALYEELSTTYSALELTLEEAISECVRKLIHDNRMIA